MFRNFGTLDPWLLTGDLVNCTEPYLSRVSMLEPPPDSAKTVFMWWITADKPIFVLSARFIQMLRCGAYADLHGAQSLRHLPLALE